MMPTQSIADPMLAPDPRTSRRLFQLGATALVVGVLWLWHQSRITDPLLLAMGTVVLVLGAWPALNWARACHVHFPVFEMFMLTGVPFYGVPLLAGHPEVLQFPEEATWQAAWSMVLFQACAVGTYLATRGRPSASRVLTRSLLPESALRYAQTGIWLNTAYLYANAFTNLVPAELHTAARAAFFGIGTVCLFIESRRWGAGVLDPTQKLTISVNVVAQLVILFRDLYLIAGISVLLLATIGYISTSRRVPFALLAVSLPLVAVLHNGKAAMRLQYWENHAPLPSLDRLPGFFEDWIEHGLRPQRSDDKQNISLTGHLFERASLFQMLCLVTERTPELEPFLEGESYAQIPAQIIPSFLWPGKPSSMKSNILLAVHFHLVDPESPGSVSIAFGMVAEAYANFGLAGCAVLGLVLGFCYKRVTLAATGSPQFSAIGLFTILLAAWSFQIEQIFATWLVSLFQATAVVVGGPLVFNALFRQE